MDTGKELQRGLHWGTFPVNSGSGPGGLFRSQTKPNTTFSMQLALRWPMIFISPADARFMKQWVIPAIVRAVFDVISCSVWTCTNKVAGADIGQGIFFLHAVPRLEDKEGIWSFLNENLGYIYPWILTYLLG